MEIKLEKWQIEMLKECPKDLIAVGRRCGLQGLRIMMKKFKETYNL